MSSPLAISTRVPFNPAAQPLNPAAQPQEQSKTQPNKAVVKCVFGGLDKDVKIKPESFGKRSPALDSKRVKRKLDNSNSQPVRFSERLQKKARLS